MKRHKCDNGCGRDVGSDSVLEGPFEFCRPCANELGLVDDDRPVLVNRGGGRWASDESYATDRC